MSNQPHPSIKWGTTILIPVDDEGSPLCPNCQAKLVQADEEHWECPVEAAETEHIRATILPALLKALDEPPA